MCVYMEMKFNWNLEIYSKEIEGSLKQLSYTNANEKDTKFTQILCNCSKKFQIQGLNGDVFQDGVFFGHSANDAWRLDRGIQQSFFEITARCLPFKEILWISSLI